MLHNSSVSKFFSHLFLFASPDLCRWMCRSSLEYDSGPAANDEVASLHPAGHGSQGAGQMGIPHEEWARRQVRTVRAFLRETGIYEMPTEEELASVTGKRTFSILDWSRKDWSLVRQVGRALHTDYAMIVERGFSKGFHESEMVLINIETGKRFKVLLLTKQDRSTTGKYLAQMNRFAYDKIFREAKNDLLATAIRKGSLAAPEFFMVKAPMPPPPSAKPAPAPLPPSSTVAKSPVEEKPSVAARPEPPPKPPAPSPVAPKPALPPEPRLEEKPSAPQEVSEKVDYDEVLSAEETAKSGTNLAVYDLDTIEPYRVVALILSEALRQELFKLGLFHMVNRENIVKVLEELALQQTGLVDEKEAARAGKGLAAQQIVLGRYGILGKNSIVQAKRVDVETQGTLGLGTLRCDVGREDELLAHMTELAREIAKKK